MTNWAWLYRTQTCSISFVSHIEVLDDHEAVVVLLVVVPDVHDPLPLRQLSEEHRLRPDQLFELGVCELLVLGGVLFLSVPVPDEVYLAEASWSNSSRIGDVIDLVNVSEWFDAKNCEK